MKQITEETSTIAIIQNQYKILITRRKKDCFLEPNKWEFPRAKVEPNESSEECIIRKVKKEFGLTIIITKLFLKRTHIYVNNNQIINNNLVAFIADWIDGNVENIDCNGSLWVDRNDLEFYDFVETDFPIIKELLTLIHKGDKKYEV